MSSSLVSIGSSTNNGSLATSLAVSGIASGMNWQTVVQELAQAERAPEMQWKKEQSSISSQSSAFSTIKTNLTTLQTDVKKLMDASFFDARAATTTDSAIASAAVVSGATTGTYSFNISQLATAAQMNGTSGISQVLAPGGDASSVTIGTAGFSAAITAGNFTVNGAQVTIATTDSLQQVFDKIASATNNAVTASYDATADKITLSGAGAITLGSSTDTSNFLQIAQLYNNGDSTVTSAAALGHARLTAALVNADLNTTVTDGGTGSGAFAINGVTINFSASVDSLQDVLDRINNSSAGVNAAYDMLNNRFTLTNITTGDVGISLQDVTGNFLAATGLSDGTLQRGQNLLYTLNGGSQPLVSQTNTITSDSSGIKGLTLTALNTGTVKASVAADTSTMSTAIQKLVTDYNAVQSYVASQMAVTTGSDSSVAAGTLTGDQNANDLVSTLRSLMGTVVNVTGTTGAVQQLASLGFKSNGQDNTMAMSDSSALTRALTSNLSDVKAFFSDATNGFAAKLNTFLDNTIGDSGTLTSHQASLTKRSNDISTQVSNLENVITSDSNRWTSAFQAMEAAQAKTNQELTYLSQQITNWSKG